MFAHVEAAESTPGRQPPTVIAFADFVIEESDVDILAHEQGEKAVGVTLVGRKIVDYLFGQLRKLHAVILDALKVGVVRKK